MSKPKEYRACVFCNCKQHKTMLLRFALPHIEFDFWQNKQGRGFYVCQNGICIDKIFKKKTIHKYLDKNVDTSILLYRLKNSIIDTILYVVGDLYNKYGAFLSDIKNDAVINNLVLCRYNTECNCDKKIILDKNLYNGSKDVCIIYNEYIAYKLIKYSKLLTNIDVLFDGELNGSKKIK